MTARALELYREFSEDQYCAQWMGSIESDERLQTEFKEWLLEKIVENARVPADISDYEEAGLPTIQRIVGEVRAAAGTLDW